MGLPEETFFISDEVSEYFAQHKVAQIDRYNSWQVEFQSWAAENPEDAKALQAAVDQELPQDLLARIPEFAEDYADATRGAGGVVIQTIAQAVPNFFTGSADLFGSTKNYIKDAGDFGRENYAGRNVWFGIREHAMGAIMNGVSYDAIFRASGATFTVFADYLRPSIRLAALAKLPVIYIFTHDSVGVGEDGPTHQPVETCSGLRVIPNLDVFRPGDPEEVAGAFAAAVSNQDGPTALLLTRQKVKTLHQIPASERRIGAERGGYVAVRESGELKLILLATGSELELAVDAAADLGDGVRVVSMPCFERFDRQMDEYREEVLPAACTHRVAIEAGVSGLWYKYVGSHGRVIGIDRFGFSAPGSIVMKELGISREHLVAVARGDS